MRVRFAPSPTGRLHVGNARTALFNWLLARGQGGTFLLRIEDTDAERSTAQSEQSILEDLRWLGLLWDEGPDVGGACGPYRQSERAAIYAAHAARLVAQGDAYYCFCSRETLDAMRAHGLESGAHAGYAGTCRQLAPEDAARRRAAGEPAALRFRVPSQREIVCVDAVRGEVRFHTDVIGDPVIVRADGTPAYNFAVVVDDALMGITHVIRGEDHLSNTPRQVLLYEALGYTAPAFAHLSLVMGPDHTPLSKRHGATSVGEFRAAGILPDALVNYLALIGWSPGDGDELLPIGELARRFALDGVGLRAGVFDPEKLAWVNRHYMKTADPGRLIDAVVPFFAQAGVPMALSDEGRAFLRDVLPIATAAVDRLDQVPGRLSSLFQWPGGQALDEPAIAAELETDAAQAVVAALAQRLAEVPRLDRDAFRAVMQHLKERTGQKGKALFHPVRVALTGQIDGPELDLLVPAIDRGAALSAASGLPVIAGCRERAAQFVLAVAARGL